MKKMKNLFLFLALIVLVDSSASAAVATSVPPTEDPTPKQVAAWIKEFKSLPRSERKARLKEVRKKIKEYKANKKAGRDGSDDRTLIIICAILIPPLGVYLYEGEITSKFWIALLLMLLFWLPGAIYALLVVTGNA